ncbi:MAG TPA: hypothetical protein VD905_12205, partial [Flavobacteriales bacterium]|nr:hypothetical protein [Flavobacteriales bacterium]
LLKHQFTALAKADVNEPVHLFGKKSVYEWAGIYTRGPGRYMLVAHISFTFQRTRVHEDKIVIAYTLNCYLDHVLIWETDMLSKVENMIAGSQKTSPTGKYTVMIVGDKDKVVFEKNTDLLDTMKGAHEEVIDKITEVLEQYGKCECEIVGKTIFIKSTVAASRTELERMLQIENHLFILLEEQLIN